MSNNEENRFINSSIPSIQEDVLTLRSENELLKSKLSKIEDICSQYVSNELAYKIKEIITGYCYQGSRRCK